MAFTDFLNGGLAWNLQKQSAFTVLNIDNFSMTIQSNGTVNGVQIVRLSVTGSTPGTTDNDTIVAWNQIENAMYFDQEDVIVGAFRHVDFRGSYFLIRRITNGIRVVINVERAGQVIGGTPPGSTDG